MAMTAEEARKHFLCGKCVKCKLIIWNEGADKLATSSKNGQFFKIDREKKDVIHVRCGWLKSSVPEPMKMQSCDAFEDIETAIPRDQREQYFG